MCVVASIARPCHKCAMSKLQITPINATNRANAATLVAKSYGADAVQIIKTMADLRSHADYDAKLDVLVQTEDNETIGYANMMPVRAGSPQAVLLAPLALDVDKNQELLQQVIPTLANYAKEQHLDYLLMHARPEDYAEFGFKPVESAVQGLNLPDDVKILAFATHDQTPDFEEKISYPEQLL